MKVLISAVIKLDILMKLIRSYLIMINHNDGID